MNPEVQKNNKYIETKEFIGSIKTHEDLAANKINEIDSDKKQSFLFYIYFEDISSLPNEDIFKIFKLASILKEEWITPTEWYYNLDQRIKEIQTFINSIKRMWIGYYPGNDELVLNDYPDISTKIISILDRS